MTMPQLNTRQGHRDKRQTAHTWFPPTGVEDSPADIELKKNPTYGLHTNVDHEDSPSDAGEIELNKNPTYGLHTNSGQTPNTAAPDPTDQDYEVPFLIS